MTAAATLLSQFSLLVDKPRFLRAKSFNIPKPWMAVYRSVMLLENDTWYEVVADALMIYSHRQVARELRWDSEMIFGRAELTVYSLGETEEEAEANSASVEACLDLANVFLD